MESKSCKCTTLQNVTACSECGLKWPDTCDCDIGPSSSWSRRPNGTLIKPVQPLVICGVCGTRYPNKCICTTCKCVTKVSE